MCFFLFLSLYFASKSNSFANMLTDFIRTYDLICFSLVSLKWACHSSSTSVYSCDVFSPILSVYDLFILSISLSIVMIFDRRISSTDEAVFSFISLYHIFYCSHKKNSYLYTLSSNKNRIKEYQNELVKRSLTLHLVFILYSIWNNRGKCNFFSTRDYSIKNHHIYYSNIQITGEPKWMVLSELKKIFFNNRFLVKFSDTIQLVSPRITNFKCIFSNFFSPHVLILESLSFWMSLYSKQ